jgi:hypothetical protein
MLCRRLTPRWLVLTLLTVLVAGYGLLALHLGNPDEHPLDHRCELAATETNLGGGLASLPPSLALPAAAPFVALPVFISAVPDVHAPRPPARAPPVAHA